MDTSLQDIGQGLASYANEEAEFSARGVLAELFPFILEASRRMSTRAISRWLAEKHNVKLSAVSVSKSLRNPERYWEEYLDTIEPFARTIELATGMPIKDFLCRDGMVDALETQMTELVGSHSGSPDEFESNMSDVDDALYELKERWFCLEESTREKAGSAIHKFFGDDEPQSASEEQS